MLEIVNEIKALFATTALGMGFDKLDLGFVIHNHRLHPEKARATQKCQVFGGMSKRIMGLYQWINMSFGDTYPVIGIDRSCWRSLHKWLPLYFDKFIFCTADILPVQDQVWARPLSPKIFTVISGTM